MLRLSRSQWMIITAVVGAGLVLGLVTGARQRATYSSTAVISSARVNVLAQAIPGYVPAATSLASTYARIATSDAVETRVADRVGLPLAYVRDNLVAVPIPDDPVLTIIGTGRSALSAMRLARSAAESLAAYTRELTTDPAATRQILAEYAAAEAGMDRSKAAVARLQSDTSDVSALRAAEAQQAQASLRVQALASAYVSASSSQTSGASVQILTAAGPPTSNRRETLADYAIVGLLVGAIVASLGVLIARLRVKRGRPNRAEVPGLPMSGERLTSED